MSGVDDTIREILTAYARLPIEVSTLSDSDDLFENGMTSHASVNVMLALEDEFDIEFPDELLRKSTFESVKAIREALVGLGVGAS